MCRLSRDHNYNAAGPLGALEETLLELGGGAAPNGVLASMMHELGHAAAEQRLDEVTMREPRTGP